MEEKNLGVIPAWDGKYVFVSYNREDAWRIRDYVIELRRQGARVWYDWGIDHTNKTEWEDALEKHIEGCEGVVMFLSRGIFRKEKSYVPKEGSTAKAYGKEIIYVACDDIKIDDVKVIDGRYEEWWGEVTKANIINAYELDSAHLVVKNVLYDKRNVPRFTLNKEDFEKDLIPFDEFEVDKDAYYNEECQKIMDTFRENERNYNADIKIYNNVSELRRELSKDIGGLGKFNGDRVNMNNVIVTLGRIRDELRGAEASFYWKYDTSRAIEERLSEASLIRNMILRNIFPYRPLSDDLYKIIKEEYKNDLEQLLTMFDNEAKGRGPERKNGGGGILKCLFGRHA